MPDAGNQPSSQQYITVSPPPYGFSIEYVNSNTLQDKEKKTYQAICASH